MIKNKSQGHKCIDIIVLKYFETKALNFALWNLLI